MMSLTDCCSCYWKSGLSHFAQEHCLELDFSVFPPSLASSHICGSPTNGPISFEFTVIRDKMNYSDFANAEATWLDFEILGECTHTYSHTLTQSLSHTHSAWPASQHHIPCAFSKRNILSQPNHRSVCDSLKTLYALCVQAPISQYFPSRTTPRSQYTQLVVRKTCNLTTLI